MADQNTADSGVNTMLLVIILILIVGFGVWWFTVRGGTKSNGNGIKVDVQLPTGTGQQNPPNPSY